MAAIPSQRKTLEALVETGNTHELPDIAEINLLCAAELPCGCEGRDQDDKQSEMRLHLPLDV